MSKVVVREANKEDIAGFAGNLPAPTLRGWIAEVEGKAVALGGLALARGRWIFFLDVTGEGRGMLKNNMYVRAALLRGAMTIMNEARKQGIRFVYAKADMAYARSDELLEKLGFHVDPRTGYPLYRWTP